MIMLNVNQVLLYIFLLKAFKLHGFQQIITLDSTSVSSKYDLLSSSTTLYNGNVNSITTEKKKMNDDLNRFLRGGSRSSGGSSHYSGWSSHSGGSSSSSNRWYHQNNNNNRNNNNNNSRNNNNRSNNNRSWSKLSTMKKLFTGLAVGVVGLAILSFLLPALGIGGMAAVGCSACTACCAGLCCGAGLTAAAVASSGKFTGSAHNQDNINQDCYYNHGNDTTSNDMNQDNQQYHDEEFEEIVQSTKDEVENSTTSYNEEIISAHPYSGAYNTSFIDPGSGTRHDAILNIYFTRDFHGRGYTISGQGSDIDGETVIEDGIVTKDGNSAWWRERAISGDVGLQVLSKGRFNFQQRTFYGVWLANSRINGSYISFSATTATTSVGNDGNSIPVAHAIPTTSSFGMYNNTPLMTVPNNNEANYTNASAPPPLTGHYDAPPHTNTLFNRDKIV